MLICKSVSTVVLVFSNINSVVCDLCSYVSLFNVINDDNNYELDDDDDDVHYCYGVTLWSERHRRLRTQLREVRPAAVWPTRSPAVHTSGINQLSHRYCLFFISAELQGSQ